MLCNTRLTAFLAFSCLSAAAIAATSFPHGCEVSDYGFIENDLVLNEQGKQAFYLIQNRSDKKIELEHIETRPDVFMSPKLETKFDASRWAAFASDVANLHFRRHTFIPYLWYMGNYWVSTNKMVEQVIKDAVSKGILLRW